MLLTVVRLLLLAEDNFESSPQFSHGHVVLKAELVKFCSGMLPLQSGKSLSFLLEFSWEENSNKQEHTINMNYAIDQTIPTKLYYNIVCIHTSLHVFEDPLHCAMNTCAIAELSFCCICAPPIFPKKVIQCLQREECWAEASIPFCPNLDNSFKIILHEWE